MINHYNIEIVDTKTHLKVTYRNGKFRKLEHLRGVISDDILRAIGRIIPPRETSIDSFTRNFRFKINYTLVVKDKSIFSQFNSEWHQFYENYTQLPPKFTAADGKALKGIISYLTNISVDEPEALGLWKLILSQWHTLDDFHKKNTDLKYINGKLNIIINAIQKENSTNVAGTNRSVEL